MKGRIWIKLFKHKSNYLFKHYKVLLWKNQKRSVIENPFMHLQLYGRISLNKGSAFHWALNNMWENGITRISDSRRCLYALKYLLEVSVTKSFKSFFYSPPHPLGSQLVKQWCFRPMRVTLCCIQFTWNQFLNLESLIKRSYAKIVNKGT